MKQVKVPKEVMELSYEATACASLADFYGGSFFSFPKAVYYATKRMKAEALIWRALRAAHPEVAEGNWVLDAIAGVARLEEEPKPEVAKKPRKPRKPKAAVEPAKQEGANEC
jgi:hypothetical protein